MPRRDESGWPLSQRLRRRREEVEVELLNRIRAIQGSTGAAEEVYGAELRVAIKIGFEFGLEAMEGGSADNEPAVPDGLLIQVRRAARSGIGLEAVLRHYCSGHTLMTDILIEEAESGCFPRSELRGRFRALAMSFERLLSAVSEEYARAAEQFGEASEEERCREVVERLLAGELIESSELAYDFASWHLGLVAFGAGAAELIAALAKTIDANLLSVRCRRGVVWAWLGARRRGTLAEVPANGRPGLAQVRVGVGEPGAGLAGWRQTHRQAAAALPLAIETESSFAAYSGAPLLAAVLRDELLATSLRQIFLAPLDEERDGGEAAKSTLRAYFEASGNASSAAAALGVNRRTISTRLANIEERLGRRLDAFSAEIETALRLDALERPARGDRVASPSSGTIASATVPAPSPAGPSS